jgi:hypothetical protein
MLTASLGAVSDIASGHRLGTSLSEPVKFRQKKPHWVGGVYGLLLLSRIRFLLSAWAVVVFIIIRILFLLLLYIVLLM